MPKATPVALVLVCFAGTAWSQQAAAPPPAAVNAAELAEALKQAGVALPDGFVINPDGTVGIPAPVAEAMAAKKAAQAAIDAAPTNAARAAARAKAEAAGVEVAAPAAAPADAPVEPIPEAEAAKWDNKIDLSLGFTDGNTETNSFRAAYAGLRETKSSKLTLDAAYFFSTNDGNTDQNKATGGVNHDWLFQNSRWLIFAGGRGDYDEFNSWKYRVSGNGGVGYRLIKREKIELTLRAGAGGTREFGSSRNEIIPEGLLGADVLWKITTNQSFESTFRYFPDLSDFAEFRTITTAAWRLDLDSINDGLGVTAGVRHEHQTVVDEGNEQNDVNVFAGLTWDF